MALQFPFLWNSSFQDQILTFRLLEEGDYHTILAGATAKSLVSQIGQLPQHQFSTHSKWINRLYSNIQSITQDSKSTRELYLIGLAALEAFLQSNVTGPPLNFQPAEIFFADYGDDFIQQRRQLSSYLTVDGEAIYGLTPHVELFALAKVLLNHDNISSTSEGGAWARLRVNFWHQKMLNDVSPSLQDSIYKDLTYLEGFIFGTGSLYDSDAKALFLLERAAVHMLHGFDQKAKDDIEEAARVRHFQYALTGRLGKRTKYQQTDLSQLVVLAKSESAEPTQQVNGHDDTDSTGREPTDKRTGGPKQFDLNDDTVLERIAFKPKEQHNGDSNQKLPPALAELDASAQPMLNPIDATILLSLASSTTNTSPDDGLTREETLPYATRVLDGGSSNWQVYTQALLVRSRIEGHKARTVERGALQLQALVDQVIAETSGDSVDTDPDAHGTTTFLPRATSSESAPALERLKYIHQLDTPPRWALEAELASRWASLGGLRTALEIYERLEMWAEASLCLAATEEEDKAIRMVRKQLFEHKETASTEDGPHDGPERSPLPADAARLLCILGDLEADTAHWERAWVVSNHRYARAQRSLGKYHVRNKNLPAAEEAYGKSLATNPQNASAWFALGCIRLELRHWQGAVVAFQRCVHLEPEDAEAWSNLAAALIHLPADEPLQAESAESLHEEDESEGRSPNDSQKHSREAFLAFKRAAALKRDSYRIWQNLLNVGATLVPPPFTDILVAQTRLLDLRSAIEGENCVDAEVLEGVLQHIITSTTNNKEIPSSPIDGATTTKPKHGLVRMFSELLHQKVIPLITHSHRLWQLAARWALFEDKPGSALEAYEKAWRTTLNQPSWDDPSSVASSVASRDNKTPGLDAEAAWNAVLEATDELVSAYESLGDREVTEGLKAGSGELVCKNWRFKARSAIRGVVGRRVKTGLGGEDVERLKKRAEELKG